MNKGQLTDGTNILWFRMELRVTLRIFTVKLSDHFYSKKEDFPSKLIKKEADKILKGGLYLNGISSEYEDGYFEAAWEEADKYNNIYEKALKWVKINHPHLIEQP